MTHEITMMSHQDIENKKKKCIALKASTYEEEVEEVVNKVKKMKTLPSSQGSLESSWRLKNSKKEGSLLEGTLKEGGFIKWWQGEKRGEERLGMLQVQEIRAH